jgi:cytochrome c-type biogenesis protein CcmF
MTPGSVVSLPGGREVKLVDVIHAPGPNYAAERAVFEVRQGNGAPTRFSAEQRYYPVREQQTAEAGIVTGAAGDVYVTVGAKRDDRGWPVSASFFPFTAWLWLGVLLVASGGWLALLEHVLSVRRARAKVVLSPPLAPAPSAAE